MAKRFETLLDACLAAEGVQGGTIHAYLPRIRWERATGPAVRGMGPVPVWSLRLDDKEIGWAQCYLIERPAVSPEMARRGNGVLLHGFTD